MIKTLKVLAVLILVGAIGSCVLSRGRQPEPFADGSDASHWLQPGERMVHFHDETFVDTARRTQANGEFPGSDRRELEATVWHPASNEGGPFPLLVYSHGFTSTREGGAYMAELMASHGYVVIAPNYPLTSMQAPGGPFVQDVVNQPGDVSFLIDSLIEQGDTPGHMLEGMVDEERIGLFGISLGGMTTTLAAFHPEMGDPRIGAAVSIAGPTEQFNAPFFRFRKVPFLMLAGDIDALVPYPSNAAPVPEKVPGSQLITITGASHTGFAGPTGPLRWMKNPDAIGCWMVLRNFDEADATEPWYELLGTREQGINYASENELCLMDPLPKAMNPLRQHMLTAVVIHSFFESQFDTTPAQREAARVFLATGLSTDAEEVSWQGAP